MSSREQFSNLPFKPVRPQSVLYGEPPPVPLGSHPLRSLSKSPVYSSTPNLAKCTVSSNSSSSDSLNLEHGLSHHTSHENIVSHKNDRRVVQVHPSTRYEWNEPPGRERSYNAGKTTGVSEGYCQLHVLNDSKTSSSGLYSVLNIDAIEHPPQVDTDDDDESTTESVVVKTDHHYFTLEILDGGSEQSQQTLCIKSNSPDIGTRDSDGSQDGFSEAEGEYFTSEEIKPNPYEIGIRDSNGSQEGISEAEGEYFTSEEIKPNPYETGTRDSNGSQDGTSEAEGEYFTSEEIKPNPYEISIRDSNGSQGGTSEAEGEYFVTEEYTIEERSSPKDQAGIYSYVELDMKKRGISPPVLVHHSKNKKVVGRRTSGDQKVPHPIKPTAKGINKESKFKGEENAYDCLRHSSMPKLKPPPLCSIATASTSSSGMHKSSGHYGKLHSQGVAKSKTRGGPTCLRTVPSPPHNKKTGKSVLSSQGEYDYLRFTNGAPKLCSSKKGANLRTTPPSSLSHNYDKVEILGDPDNCDDVLSDDDDVPIPLPLPTSPPLTAGPLSTTFEREDKTSLPHSNLVHVVITENGPILVPRTRSHTADSGTLKQFHSQSKNKAPRSASATGNEKKL